MLDIGWSELLLIGVVALIVVGPRDLPHLFHSLGRITARARAMAREFSSAMEDAARTSGIDDATKTLRDVKSLTSKKSLGLDALDRAADRFEKWDPKLPARNDPAPADPGQAGPLPADSQTPASALPAGSGAEPAAETGAAPLPPAPEHEPGQRRLHAVRRSDTKDR
ncbi:sec-independent protein translocase protein TatB [Paracoccus halophilus]|uniref:Preprotein translocase subunit TatA n=1 Tax=Paracoccus halophilus TaxID=376733 RepID=A0A099F4K0_9RHOB|nr:Sec-independent protein translocase protein TatB [Paracoccus halophilus]KGJ05131.1 preprotein translocase subunit TatA [Paracoccus halophilus]SFA43949.1 sec-independent protein translocase protein TatB [Paracoccus halophilus]